jgi:predicted dienelactone hydrolase
MSMGSLHKYIGEHLSSHGYLVAAPNHYGDTLGTPSTDTVYPDRVADLKRVLDEAASRSDWQPYLEAGVASVGHSIGGFDALALCGASIDAAAVAAECAGGSDSYCRLEEAKSDWPGYTDARVATCVGLTPFVHPIFGSAGEGGAGIDRPVLLLGATRDPNSAARPLLASFLCRKRTEGVYLIESEGAGHLDFTDFLFDGTIDHGLLKTVVNAQLAAWLAWQLDGDVRAGGLFSEESIEAGAYAEVLTFRPR